MSFFRLVYYHALLGGWAALVGWFLSELLFMQRSSEPDLVPILLTTALVGAFISGGLSQVQGLVQFRLGEQLKRLGIGLAGGLLGGLLGGLIGNSIVTLLPREIMVLAQAVGWLFLGLAIGGVEGAYTLSLRSLRNGLIGGAVGGFLGGLLYLPIFQIIGGVMSSRAVAFVLLGVCIGLFIGLAQVILKEAWLTVTAGYRAGRQLLLAQKEILMGTSEKVHLQFVAFGAKGVEPIHLRVVRQENGTYVVQDNNSRMGTFVNGQPVKAAVLRNDDVIRLGVNEVRFQESYRRDQAPGPVLPVPGPDRSRASSETLAQMLKPGAPPISPPRVSGSAPPSHPAAPPQILPVPASPPPSPGIKPAVPVVAPKPVPRPVPRPPASPTNPAPAPAPVARPQPPAPAPAPVARPRPPAPQAPVSPAASSPAPKPKPASPSACPVCGHVQQGSPGKRSCENCGMRF